MRVEIPRSFFNVMAKEAHIADWREAFTYGQAKATGVEQILKLIAHVVEKQEERQRTRRARQLAGRLSTGPRECSRKVRRYFLA